MYTLFTAQRDDAATANSVGLFADLRDLHIHIDPVSSTVADVVMQVAHTLRHRLWNQHDFRLAGSSTWLNLHPRDKNIHPGGFRALTEMEMHGPKNGLADEEDDDGIVESGETTSGPVISSPSVGRNTTGVGVGGKPPRGRTKRNAREKLKFVLDEVAADEWAIKIAVSDRYVRELNNMRITKPDIQKRNEWIRRFWMCVNKAIMALISDPMMRTTRALGENEQSVCRPWEDVENPRNTAIQKFFKAGGWLEMVKTCDRAGGGGDGASGFRASGVGGGDDAKMSSSLSSIDVKKAGAASSSLSVVSSSLQDTANPDAKLRHRLMGQLLEDDHDSRAGSLSRTIAPPSISQRSPFHPHFLDGISECTPSSGGKKEPVDGFHAEMQRDTPDVAQTGQIVGDSTSVDLKFRQSDPAEPVVSLRTINGVPDASSESVPVPKRDEIYRAFLEQFMQNATVADKEKIR